jgi:putative membrane protein
MAPASPLGTLDFVEMDPICGGDVMWWWHGDWSWWGVLGMTVSMLVFFGVVTWAVVTFFLPAGTSAEDSPEARLGQRFANGEIDEDEYRQRLDVLRHTQTPARRSG